ncbi:MAG: hypothetical protein GX898_00020 [Corynebacterium sp.]|nr:hypothetical protein [Corynebacterium sp.]
MINNRVEILQRSDEIIQGAVIGVSFLRHVRGSREVSFRIDGFERFIEADLTGFKTSGGGETESAYQHQRDDGQERNDHAAGRGTECRISGSSTYALL